MKITRQQLYNIIKEEMEEEFEEPRMPATDIIADALSESPSIMSVDVMEDQMIVKLQKEDGSDYQVSLSVGELGSEWDTESDEFSHYGGEDRRKADRRKGDRRQVTMDLGGDKTY